MANNTKELRTPFFLVDEGLVRENLEILRQVAEEAGVENADIKVQDFGALDCTIRARVETALERASKEETAS